LREENRKRKEEAEERIKKNTESLRKQFTEAALARDLEE